jgi:hypothetical protein
MKGDFQVRFRENLRVKLPWVTRLCVIPKILTMAMRNLLLGVFILLNYGISNGQKYFIVQNSSANYGILDTTSRILLDFKYKGLRNMWKCLIVTDSIGKKGLLSKTLDEILPLKFEKIKGDCSDWIVASVDGKYGYYDSLGNMRLDHKYIEASLFHHDSALVIYESSNEIRVVCINRIRIEISRVNLTPWDIFNKTGKVSGGVRVVNGLKRKRKHYGLYVKGKWVIPPIYDSIQCTLDYFYIVKKGHLTGLFNKDWVIVLPVIYKEIESIY